MATDACKKVPINFKLAFIEFFFSDPFIVLSFHVIPVVRSCICQIRLRSARFSNSRYPFYDGSASADTHMLS